MAQVDENIVTRLRKAILNIYRFPRGCRYISDYSARPLIPSMPIKEGKEFLKIMGDCLDEHVFTLLNNYFDSQAPFQLEDALITGSINEGTWKIDFKKHLISDTDFMLILKNIKVTQEDQKNGNLTVKESTAFVNLYLTDADLIKMWTDFLETSSNARREKRAKLSSMKLKERFREKYVAYGPFLCPFSNEDIEDVNEGPSIAVSSETPTNEKTKQSAEIFQPFLIAEFDFVLAIKCDGWPLCAQEWLSRSRCWPNQDILHTIVESGFHIVCKESCEGDFRLSYSNAESILIQNLSDMQHKTYRAFKSFVNHYKNEWSSNIKKIVCSYHLKTILLWYCEKSDPRDWTEERIVGHLLSLIDELISALKKRDLPMYFMPKYNLMEKIEDSTEVVKKIEDLRFTPDSIAEAIISEEPSFQDWANLLLNSYRSAYSQPFVKAIQNRHFDLNDFLQCMSTVDNLIDEHWINAVGKIPWPTRHDELGRKAKNKMFGPVMKCLEKLCKQMNHIYLNKPMEKGDDEN